jgi:Ca-activated chloride channel homolog
MTVHSITLVHPIWLLVGLVAAAGILLLALRLARQRRAALAAFSSRHNGAAASLSRPRRALKQVLLAVGVLAGCVALARPQWGVRWEETHRRGLDLLFALDTSKSMLTPDLKPDRLTRAKLAIRDLVSKFEGDRVGLVAFAGEAFLQCPLTLDRGVFERSLDAVDTTLIPRGGTDVGRAIEVAGAALQNQPTNHKLLVFLTDGEDLEGHAVAAGRAAAGAGIRIYAVGVGTPGGELIPLAGAPGRFVRDEAGAFVRSRLDEQTLQAVARTAGGDYRRLGVDGRGLEALYQDVLGKLPRESLGSRMRQVPRERYQWPLGLSLVCLALEPLVRERRRRPARAPEPPRRERTFPVLRRRVVVALALGLGLLAPHLAHASPRAAERAYHQGRFQQSAAEYERAVARSPGDAKLQYNLGAAQYKSGDFAKAGAALARALRSDRLELQQSAYYDLGNTLYRVGQKTVATQPEQTIEQWKKAIASYEAAIRLDAKDADAIYNRDFVKRKLDELERQQKQKDQQKQPPNKQCKQNKPGQQNKQNKQGQQDQQNKQNKQNKQGQQDKQNKQGQGQPQQGQGQPKPATGRPAQNATAPTAANAKPGQRQTEATVPGRLSRSDAKALLDALRGDERLMRVAPDARRHAVTPDAPVRKDW